MFVVETWTSDKRFPNCMINFIKTCTVISILKCTYSASPIVTCSCRIADAEDAERKVNAINSRGCTALHYACWNGHQKVAETLKKAKADPFKKCVQCKFAVNFVHRFLAYTIVKESRVFM